MLKPLGDKKYMLRIEFTKIIVEFYFGLAMGLGQRTLTRVGSAIFGLGLSLENLPLKSQIFQFFSLRIKKIASGRVKKYSGQSRVGSYLLWVKSMLGPGRVRAHHYFG